MTFVETFNSLMPNDDRLSELLGELIQNHDINRDYNMATPILGGAKKKVRVLGRLRNITKVGRKSMVIYRGELITLTDARKMEKNKK